MRKDPIIAEIHAHREAIARASGYDMKRIMADLRKSERERTGPDAGTKRSGGGQPKRSAARKRRAA